MSNFSLMSFHFSAGAITGIDAHVSQINDVNRMYEVSLVIVPYCLHTFNIG